MKKLLLLLSFLASQLLAVQCTDEQYKPYFDKNNDRYMYSYTLASDKSKVLIDKKNIVYDKVNQKIKCWTIAQQFDSPEYGVFNTLWEFNLKNNQVRVIQAQGYNCKGKLIFEESQGDWYDIVPNSGNEQQINDLKKYLNIQ